MKTNHTVRPFDFDLPNSVLFLSHHFESFSVPIFIFTGIPLQLSHPLCLLAPLAQLMSFQQQEINAMVVRTICLTQNAYVQKGVFFARRHPFSRPFSFKPSR